MFTCRCLNGTFCDPRNLANIVAQKFPDCQVISEDYYLTSGLLRLLKKSRETNVQSTETDTHNYLVEGTVAIIAVWAMSFHSNAVTNDYVQRRTY